MTFKQLETFLRSIDLILNPTGTFLHGGRKKLSQHHADNFPQTHLYPLVKTEDREGNINFTLTMIFFEQASLAETLAEETDIIDNSETRLDAFYDYIQDNYPQYSLGPKAIGEREVLYTESLQATATGCSLRFNIQMKKAC